MTEPKTAQNVLAVAINAMDFIPQMASDRLRSLYMEIEELMDDDVDRELLINYISGNFATNTHLCVTVLRGKRNEDIVQIASEIRSQIKDELTQRKRSSL